MMQMKESEPLIPPAFSGRPLTAGNTFTAFVGIFTTMCGGGVLGLPASFHYSGVFLGILGILIHATLSGYSIYYLTVVADITGEYSFETISSRVLGSIGVWILRILTLFVLFGTLVMYMILGIDLLGPILYPTISRFWIGLFFVTIAIPLSIPDTIYALRRTNSLVFICLIYITVAMSIRTLTSTSATPISIDANPHNLNFWGQLKGAILSWPIQSVSFGCHVNSVRAYGELQRKSDMKTVTLLVMGVGSTIYIIFSVMGYAYFHGNPPTNLLQGFSMLDGVINSTRIVLALCMLLKIPLTFQPFREILELCCFGFDGRNPTFRNIFTVSFILFAWLCASYDEYTLALTTLGGTGALISYFVPGAFLFAVAPSFSPLPTNYLLPSIGLMTAGLSLSILSAIDIM